MDFITLLDFITRRRAAQLELENQTSFNGVAMTVPYDAKQLSRDVYLPPASIINYPHRQLTPSPGVDRSFVSFQQQLPSSL